MALLKRILKAIATRSSVVSSALVCIIIVCGCTRNNGDIGEWFGTWQITEITADGNACEGYERNIFLKFQNTIVCMVRVNTSVGANHRDEAWGTWGESDGFLSLDFTYSDDKYPIESGEKHQGIYAPFEETHIPYGEVSSLAIEHQSGGHMTLRYDASGGISYAYTLKKQ